MCMNEVEKIALFGQASSLPLILPSPLLKFDSRSKEGERRRIYDNHDHTIWVQHVHYSRCCVFEYDVLRYLKTSNKQQIYIERSQSENLENGQLLTSSDSSKG